MGDNLQRQVNVRIIAATNRDLLSMVKSGTFREDLYYRICVMPLPVPPLRDRRGDILPLAVHFLERERAQMGKKVGGFSRAAMDKLLGYPWPGNIRELENKIKQSLILATGDLIDADDILLDSNSASDAGPHAVGTGAEVLEQPPAEAAEPGGDGHVEARVPGVTLNEARRQFERRYLIGVLRRNRGNATMAARESGKHRSEFYYLLKKHGILPAEFREEAG